MGTRGPKPLPTNVRRLRGETRPSQIGEAEPQPPAGDVQPPADLTGRALEHWRRLAPMLDVMGLLTVADVDHLAALCHALDDLEQAHADIKRRGIVLDTKDGGRVRNPSTLVRRECVAILLSMGARFGLSPSDRAALGRSGYTPKDEGSDLLDG